MSREFEETSFFTFPFVLFCFTILIFDGLENFFQDLSPTYILVITVMGQCTDSILNWFVKVYQTRYGVSYCSDGGSMSDDLRYFLIENLIENKR